MRVVVTAGGTSEPIDDVRVITNRSTGRFGAAIANALSRRGHEVVLLAGDALASHPERVDPAVRVVPFGSFADLDRALAEATATPPDAVFMAAAVSDYSPVPAAGKIRSDPDELTITLKRTPKLLAGLRERCPDATLIGFKLLSGVSEEELVKVARAQVAANRLDACVANDQRHLRGDVHPIVLVTPGGGTERRTGSKEAVASWLVAKTEALRGVPSAPAQWVGERGPIRGLELSRLAPDAVVLPTATCAGTAEVERALARAAWEGGWDGGPFAVRTGIDTVIGAPPGRFVEDSARAAAATLAELRAHGVETGGRPNRPVVDRGRAIGATVELPEGTFVSLTGLDERQRDGVVAALAPRRVVAAPDDLWKEHGWTVIGSFAGLEVLAPPVVEGRREAASVCLLDPIGRRVLIGCRRTPPWQGYWAFPGGRREPGEDLLATALRELEEETGIRIPRARPVRERRVFAGNDPGFVITNFVLPVLEPLEPAPTEEIDARWVDLAEVSALRPMAGGTRLVLAGLDRVRW